MRRGVDDRERCAERFGRGDVQQDVDERFDGDASEHRRAVRRSAVPLSARSTRDQRPKPLVGRGLRARTPWIPQFHAVRWGTDEGEPVRECSAAMCQQSRGLDAVCGGAHQQEVVFLWQEVGDRCWIDQDTGPDRPELAALCSTLQCAALCRGEATRPDQRDGEDSFVHVPKRRAVDRRDRRGRAELGMVSRTSRLWRSDGGEECDNVDVVRQRICRVSREGPRSREKYDESVVVRQRVSRTTAPASQPASPAPRARSVRQGPRRATAARAPRAAAGPGPRG